MSTAIHLIEIHAAGQRRATLSNTEHNKPRSFARVLPKEFAFYRKYTEAMLRRYMRQSLSVGRMPALLGHDAFRGKMSTYRVTSFEDAVIFVHDVGKCLDQLDAFSREIIRRIAIQEYTQSEAANLLGISLRTTVRRYAEAIDSLTKIFITRGLLDIDPLDESS